MANAYLAGASRGRIHEDVKRPSFSPRWRRAELNKRKGRRGRQMLNVSRIHIRHSESPCNTRFAYPTYLANARDTRRHVRAWMRIRRNVGTFICSYPDWPYRSGARDTSILPFATRMRSSLISRESNPVTRSRNQRFASSFSDDIGCPRWTIPLLGAPSFTARLTQ